MAVFPILTPIFQPYMRVITAITYITAQNQFIYTVTTSTDHNYHPGLQIRLDIPIGFGAESLNGNIQLILTVPSPTTFTFSVTNNLGYLDDAFAIPMGAQQSAQSIPVAEKDFELDQAVRNILP